MTYLLGAVDPICAEFIKAEDLQCSMKNPVRTSTLRLEEEKKLAEEIKDTLKAFYC